TTNTILAEETISDKRMALYHKIAALTQLDWYYLAAMDQYERSINKEQDDEKIVSITIPYEQWFGIGNHTFDKSIQAIQLFDGIGQDGNGDGRADPDDPEDMLLTVSNILLSEGVTEDDI